MKRKTFEIDYYRFPVDIYTINSIITMLNLDDYKELGIYQIRYDTINKDKNIILCTFYSRTWIDRDNLFAEIEKQFYIKKSGHCIPTSK